MGGLEITFLGTGTSHGVPVIGCACAVCLSGDPRDKRLRTSVLVCAPDAVFVVDTSPDFRAQCLREGLDRLDAVVYTHSHTDHILGFDDLRRFCEIEDKEMPIYAKPDTLDDLRRVFRFAFDDGPKFRNYIRPAPQEITGEFHIGDTGIVPVELPHGRFTTTGFVLSREGEKLFAYMTDCNGVPEEAAIAAEGVRVLVVDALRHRKHPTHMTVEEAIAASRRIGAGETYLTHLCHEVGHAETEAGLPEGVHLAYDGLRIHVG